MAAAVQQQHYEQHAAVQEEGVEAMEEVRENGSIQKTV